MCVLFDNGDEHTPTNTDGNHGVLYPQATRDTPGLLIATHVLNLLENAFLQSTISHLSNYLTKARVTLRDFFFRFCRPPTFSEPGSVTLLPI